jgi:hypothetical protein
MISFKTINVHEETEVKECTYLLSAELKFEGFALVQFFEGMKLIPYSSPHHEMLKKLMDAFIKINYEEFIQEYYYSEIKQLIEFLNIRLEHCVKERGSKKFNQETYLNMKLLLIDLRELIVPKIS